MKPFQKPALYCNFQPFSRVVISAKHLEIVCVSHYVHMLQIAPLEFRISTRTVEHPIRPGTPYFTWRWVVDWYASPLAMYPPIKFIYSTLSFRLIFTGILGIRSLGGSTLRRR